MYTGLHVKYRCYSCQISMKLEISRQFFEKCSNIKFHENPSIGSRVVPRGRTDRHEKKSQWLFSALLWTRLKQIFIHAIRLTTSDIRYNKTLHNDKNRLKCKNREYSKRAVLHPIRFVSDVHFEGESLLLKKNNFEHPQLLGWYTVSTGSCRRLERS
jgi:hypothetical protein